MRLYEGQKKEYVSAEYDDGPKTKRGVMLTLTRYPHLQPLLPHPFSTKGRHHYD